MISFIIPTFNRCEVLAHTLAQLGVVEGLAPDSCEVIVVDNASDRPVVSPPYLENGLPVRVVRATKNMAAAGRNLGARAARGTWLIMLDDDSCPLDSAFINVLTAVPDHVAALGADITLPNGRREAGGLPEVFTGCGVAIRRDPFLNVGGYDASFDYYVEEYDLAAKLLLEGWTIVHDVRFRVLHRKHQSHRDFNRIMQRLVRNNLRVLDRYAPPTPSLPPQSSLASHLHASHFNMPPRSLEWHMADTIARYARIAMKEDAAKGFAIGMAGALDSNLAPGERRPMSEDLFDRFTGLAHVRETLLHEPALAQRPPVAITNSGKNEWAVRQALSETGCPIVDDASAAEVLVIGTIAPGPMLDAWSDLNNGAPHRTQPVILPWRPEGLAVMGITAAEAHPR